MVVLDIWCVQQIGDTWFGIFFLFLLHPQFGVMIHLCESVCWIWWRIECSSHWSVRALAAYQQINVCFSRKQMYHLRDEARWDDQRGAYGFVHVPTGHFMPRAIASGPASNEFGHNLFQAGVPADGPYMHCYRSVVCGASPDRTNW